MVLAVYGISNFVNDNVNVAGVFGNNDAGGNNANPTAAIPTADTNVFN